MNHTAKNLIRIAGVVAGLGAAVWALRDRLLPAPEVHDEPPPRFRTATTQAEASTDDLTAIKGIGPVKATALHKAGIDTFAELSSMSADELADTARTSTTTAQAWIEAAAELG
ncbi:MAG: helix-hairpin-helix domain-containing protein [Actinomycetia bacterium]|nr:helix-hairpin-helix domain-containing protein [Actinomycetes bacterium]